MNISSQVYIDLFNYIYFIGNNLKKLPLTIMRLTIKKFQELHQASLTNLDEIDKSILLIQIFTGKSEFEINKMSIKKFNRLCSRINKSFDIISKGFIEGKPKNLIKANGKWYWLNLEINEMTAGRYVETATFASDVIGNLHKLMATMCTPMKWTWKGLVPDKYNAEHHAKYAEDMLEANFNDAYQSCVFFYAVFSESMKSLQSSLEGDQMEKQMLNQNLMIFKNLMDGCLMPSWSVNLKISV